MIDKDNPSLCPFAFEHSYISPTYERKLCCIAEKKSPPKKLSQEDFWNGEYMRDVRKKMVVGKKFQNALNVIPQNLLVYLLCEKQHYRN